MMQRCLTPTNQMISNIVQMELAYINTNHPDFIGGSAADNGSASLRQRPGPIPQDAARSTCGAAGTRCAGFGSA